MFLDTQLRFSGSIANDATATVTGQAITATAISANVIDLRQPAGTPALVDESVGEWGLELIVKTTTATNGADAAKTLTTTLESATDTGLTAGVVVHASSGAITGANLPANTVFWRLRPPFGNYARYLGLRYTVSAGFTAFGVEAFLTPDIDRNIIYPNNYTIDA